MTFLGNSIELNNLQIKDQHWHKNPFKIQNYCHTNVLFLKH